MSFISVILFDERISLKLIRIIEYGYEIFSIVLCFLEMTLGFGMILKY